MHTELIMLIVVFYIVLGSCYALGLTRDMWAFVVTVLTWPIALLFMLGYSHAKLIKEVTEK